MIEIKRITTLDPFYEQERHLRNIVLLRPIGIPDNAWEMNDSDSWHFVAIKNKEVIGCVVLYPIESGTEKAQLMQMAIKPKFQGIGIGKLLINDLIAFARKEGVKEIICHSRQNVNTFYEKIGFEIYGQSFEEVGISHNHMKLKI